MAKVRRPFRATLEGGHVLEGVVRPVDLVATERALGGVSEKNQMTTGIHAAWHALHRQGGEIAQLVGTFDEYLDRLEDFEESEEADALGEATPGQDPEPVSLPA